MDDIEYFRGFLGFVGLQMANEMVMGVGIICEFQPFGVELLDIVFTEVPQAERIGLLDRRSRKFLGDSPQQDVGALASGTRRRIGDAGFHLVYFLFEQWSIID